MELLARDAVPALALRSEEVALESLGAKVIVQGRWLWQTMALNQINTELARPLEGESTTQAERRAGVQIVSHALAWQVVLGDGAPMYSAEQWSLHGATHPLEVLALYKVAERLSGAEVETTVKN